MSQNSDTKAAALAINAMIEKMAKKNVDPDHLSFVMIAAAYSMLLRNNIDNPFLVSTCLTSAMQAAVQSIMEEDVAEEIRH